jgi:hypothetical protein
LIVLFSQNLLAAYSSNDQAQRAIQFANSAIECGIYYQYMARGMSNNPKIPSEMIKQVSDKAEMLINTADGLYGAAGVSTKTKYNDVLLKAKDLVAQRNLNKENMSDLIYERGKTCQVLLLNYNESVKEFLDPIENY